MSMNTLTITGNLTGPLELRFTPSGAAVANGTIASTPRKFNRQTNEWEDEPTIFIRFSCWRALAENAAETLSEKGLPVVATGKLKSRPFEDKEGNQRTSWELDVETIGPDLRFSTGQVRRHRPGGSGSTGSGGFGGGAANTYDATSGAGSGFGGQSADPWGGQPAGSGGSGWPAEEPPF
ncbi:single-stranded DNA-binding protein [Nesterenkonia sp. HG001]|uniref:single-stranded DNA-binding protein n=1 Tax=Nesterenkonia sp. HG001 TaxID=2983207 RepID=UPI002AC5CA40|nr:single-stranded DNA-binding protein [Nesterenkonia sp. HG001]MDZ5076775.1 single-stranded DNA-binding protein [Nesterenkonia sp. HG001]